MKDEQHLIDMYANPQKFAELVGAEIAYVGGGEYTLSPQDGDLAALELRVAAALGLDR